METIKEFYGGTSIDSDDVEYIYNQVMKSNDPDKVLFISGLYPTGKKQYYAVNLSVE